MYMYIYFLKVHMYMYGMEYVLLEISLPIVRINGFCVQNREKPRFFMKKKACSSYSLEMILKHF